MAAEMVQVRGEVVRIMPTPTGDWNVTVRTVGRRELVVLMSDEQVVGVLAEDEPHSRSFWLSWLSQLRIDLGYPRAQKPLC